MIRRSPITRKVRVKPRRTGKPRRSSRELNPEFLAFCRLLPCFRCSRNAYHFFARNTVESVARYVSQKTPTEAAHIGLSTDRRGLSQKYDDDTAISACGECHVDLHRIGPERFFFEMGTDRDSVIGLFRRMFADYEGKVSSECRCGATFYVFQDVLDRAEKYNVAICCNICEGKLRRCL